MSEAIIRLENVNKWYGQFHVLRNINLNVARGERIVICGPSGSGKSTMIRCINRLEEHQQGHIIVEGKELTNDLKDIEAIRREGEAMPGMFRVLVTANAGVFVPGDDLLFIIAAGDIREHVLASLTYTLTRVKSEAITKREVAP